MRLIMPRAVRFWVRSTRLASGRLSKTMEAFLLMATDLASVAKSWPQDQLEGLEASREFCRAICWHCGITYETECASELWIVLTMTKSKMNGFSGDDISLQSMGLLAETDGIDLSYLQRLNLYQKRALLDDLKCLVNLLPQLKDIAPSLVWQVNTLAHDVDKLIA